MPSSLTDYLTRFSKLRRNHHREFGNAPHKPVLLLTLLHAIDAGVVKESVVPITPELAAIFSALWESLVLPDTWQEQMAYPFRYLISDGFWQLVKDGRVLTGEEVGVPRDLFQLAERVDGGRFTPELWHLLQDTTARASLRQQLLTTYFPAHTEAVFSTDSVLAMQARRLEAQAAAKFRTRPTIVDDAGQFVRHSLLM